MIIVPLQVLFKHNIIYLSKSKGLYDIPEKAKPWMVKRSVVSKRVGEMAKGSTGSFGGSEMIPANTVSGEHVSL